MEMKLIYKEIVDWTPRPGGCKQVKDSCASSRYFLEYLVCLSNVHLESQEKMVMHVLDIDIHFLGR